MSRAADQQCEADAAEQEDVRVEGLAAVAARKCERDDERRRADAADRECSSHLGSSSSSLTALSAAIASRFIGAPTWCGLNFARSKSAVRFWADCALTCRAVSVRPTYSSDVSNGRRPSAWRPRRYSIRA